MRRYVTPVAAVLVMLMLAAFSCGSDDDSEDEGGELPDAAELMTEAADEMAQVETVAIQLAADTDVGDVPIREVDGVVTREGEAEGTAQIEQAGVLVEVQFVVIDDVFHYQLVGGWQQLPLDRAGEFYDPSTILDPDRGVANLLRTAQDPTVEAQEDDAYRVTATWDGADLAVLVPGATEQTEGTVWIGVDRPVLQRAEFPVDAGAAEVGTLTASLSNFDEPVDISAP